MLVRVDSSRPGRGLVIALFALLIAGSAALVAIGAAGAGSADEARAHGAGAAASASRVGLSLSAMTTQQALRAVLDSGAAPPSAGAASAAGAVPSCARTRWLRHPRSLRHPRLDLTRLRPARYPAARHRLRSRCRRRAALRLLARGVHGQLTYRTAKGFATLAFERGTVASASGTTVTVTAADNTTWIWHLTSSTVVRRGGHRVTATALTRGQRVLAVGPVAVGPVAAGPVAGGQDEARLIVVVPPRS